MSAKDWLEKDYYKILGVSKDAKPEQIKKAFRKVARENHPDQHPGDKKAEQRFKEASEANDVLSDPQKRREYDEQRSLFSGGFRFPRGGGSGASDVFSGMGGGDLSDLLGNFFGGGGSGRRSGRGQRTGADIEGEVSISFQQAMDGTTVGVHTTSEEACPTCHGTGAKTGTAPRVCPACQGSGTEQTTAGGVFQVSQPCHECGGRGLVIDDPCTTCHGSGRAASSRTIQVRIPAGVADGQRIRIKGKGSPGSNGGPDGDLYVLVRVRPDKIFGRSGDDLTVQVPVSFAEAALGAEIDVPTMGGGSVKLRIPAGTPNGRTFRVRGRGVTKGSKTGDLLVSVEVQVPSTMSPAAAEALRAYADTIAEPNPRAEMLGRKR